MRHFLLQNFIFFRKIFLPSFPMNTHYLFFILELVFLIDGMDELDVEYCLELNCEASVNVIIEDCCYIVEGKVGRVVKSGC